MDGINETIEVTDSHRHLHRGPRVHAVLFYYIIYCMAVCLLSFFSLYGTLESQEQKITEFAIDEPPEGSAYRPEDHS